MVHAPRRAPLRLAPLLLAALLAGSGLLHGGWAATTHAGHATLPSPIAFAASVWTGEHVLVYGGEERVDDDWTRAVDRIVRFTPATGEVVVLDERLPRASYREMAFWDGRDRPDAGCPGGCAYVLGQGTDVLRHNPSTGAVALLPGVLPQPAFDGGLAWTGEVAYLFGGIPAPYERSAAIWRYDPAAGTVERVAVDLPRPLARFDAVWTGEAAYLFGGEGCPPARPERADVCDEILRFDPVGERVETAGRLPWRLEEAAAAWDGERAFVFGGVSDAGFLNPFIVRFDPATGEVVRMAPRLPSARTGVSAVWAGDAAYAVGGEINNVDPVDDVVKVTFEPSAPPTLEAKPMPGSGLVSLSWTPPAHDTYSVLTGYRVYRSVAPVGTLADLLAPHGLAPVGDAWTLVGQVDAGATSFLDAPPLGAYAYRVSAVNAGRDEGPRGPSAAAPSLPPLP